MLHVCAASLPRWQGVQPLCPPPLSPAPPPPPTSSSCQVLHVYGLWPLPPVVGDAALAAFGPVPWPGASERAPYTPQQRALVDRYRAPAPPRAPRLGRDQVFHRGPVKPFFLPCLFFLLLQS